eukprot:4878282-Ditylum_brightwellii.AAC.1
MAHFYVEQGYLSIKYLTGHICEDSLTGNHLLVLVSQAPFVSGSFFLYLCYTESRIILANTWKLYLQREHDVMLMDLIEEDNPIDDDGNFLYSWALVGFDHWQPIILWPNQHKPAKCSWQIGGGS